MPPTPKLIVTIFTIAFLGAVVSSHKSTAQKPTIFKERERTIKKRSDFNPPLKIKAVKTKGRSVPLDKPFIDQDDWLNGFTVIVRNDAIKAVTHVGVKMVFRVSGDAIPAAWMLHFGPDPFLNKNSDVMPTSTLPSVPPGGEIELKLNEDELKALTEFLKKVGFPDTPNNVEIRVN